MDVTQGVLLPEARNTPPPSWWSMKGYKMECGQIYRHPSRVRIHNGEVAALQITRRGPRMTRSFLPWALAWNIDHGIGEVGGQIFVSTAELRAAFRLEDTIPEAKRGAVAVESTVSCEGAFVRLESYLNVPCPGYRCFGDPNLSIYVSDNIRDAVAELIKLAG